MEQHPRMNAKPISFGDRVRIRSSVVTEELGLAQTTGIVHGETTPSVTGVTVIGESNENRAVHVFFEDRNEGFWFAPDLVEFMDHAPGARLTVAGKKWVRAATGDWEETIIARKPWWKFW